jgi:hypothetical protein
MWSHRSCRSRSATAGQLIMLPFNWTWVDSRAVSLESAWRVSASGCVLAAIIVVVPAIAAGCGGKTLATESDGARDGSAGADDGPGAGMFGLCPVVPPQCGSCGTATRVDCLYVTMNPPADAAQASGAHWSCLDGGWQDYGPSGPCGLWLCEDFVQNCTIEPTFSACIVGDAQQCCGCDGDGGVSGLLTKCGPC